MSIDIAAAEALIADTQRILSRTRKVKVTATNMAPAAPPAYSMTAAPKPTPPAIAMYYAQLLAGNVKVIAPDSPFNQTTATVKGSGVIQSFTPEDFKH